MCFSLSRLMPDFVQASLVIAGFLYVSLLCLSTLFCPSFPLSVCQFCDIYSSLSLTSLNVLVSFRPSCCIVYFC